LATGELKAHTASEGMRTLVRKRPKKVEGGDVAAFFLEIQKKNGGGLLGSQGGVVRRKEDWP